MYDYTVLNLAVLIASGIAAGFINVLAGGGSLLTLPALMLAGLPADVANGTNRICVFTQSVAAVRDFHNQGRLDRGAILPVLAPTIAGSAIGALAASWIDRELLRPILLGTLLAMALLMVLKPAVVAPPEGTRPYRLSERKSAVLWLFAAGLYGGFIQAGVGFVLLTALAGVLRYDLVRANALKLVCTAIFGVVALGIFIYYDLVHWGPGLILAAATVVGARIGVHVAVRASQRALRLFLLAMVVVVTIAALLKG